MNQKQIGIILIVIGILLASSVFYIKYKEDAYTNKIIIEQGGSCYLPDGTCLHEERALFPYILGWIISAAVIMLGVYLILFDKTQKLMVEQHEKISTALKDATEKDEFTAFLTAFSEDEQKLLKTIKEQDGITQATLRYRTGISKTSVSLMLKSLEERGFISRKISGKTNQVFLRKKF